MKGDAVSQLSIYSDGGKEGQSPEMYSSSKRVKRHHTTSVTSFKYTNPTSLGASSTPSDYTTTKPKSLFDLPREVRDHIYDIYLGSIDFVFPDKRCHQVRIVYRSKQGDGISRLPGRLPSWIHADKAPHQLHKEVLEQFHRLAQFEYEFGQEWDPVWVSKLKILRRSHEVITNDAKHLLKGVQLRKMSNVMAFYHPQGPRIHRYAQLETHWTHYPRLRSLLSDMADLRNLTVCIEIYDLIMGAKRHGEHRISFQFPDSLSSTSLVRLRIEVAHYNGFTNHIDGLFGPLAEEVKEIAGRIMRGGTEKCHSRVEETHVEYSVGNTVRSKEQKTMIFEVKLDGYR